MRLRFTGSINRRFVKFEVLLLALILALCIATQRSQADTGVCSGQTITLPFTDVMGNGLFCSIAQIYFQGITLGVTPTTYDPTGNVRRDQMAAFLARTQNSVLNRGSRRAALNQFWTTKPQYDVPAGMFGTTAVGNSPVWLASDGADLWVANSVSNSVSRVRASDGRLLETWTGATNALGVLAALGRVFVTGSASVASDLYVINPSQAPGTVTTLFSMLPPNSGSMAFDGEYLWVAGSGTVMKLLLHDLTPFYFGGFANVNYLLYDGTNIWVAQFTSPGSLKKLNGDGGVITTVTVGNEPAQPVYDGTNIWVPNSASNSLSVVRPSDGAVLATLTGNGLNQPRTAAFDGQRILVTNHEGHSVSLWRAADFTPLGSFSTGSFSRPFGACSDGLNFWITLNLQNKLARF